MLKVEEKLYQINSLPVKTWNRLKINSTNINIPQCDTFAEPVFKNADFLNAAVSNEALPALKSGMGDDISRINAANPRGIHTVTIPENTVSDTPLIIEYRYGEGYFSNTLNIRLLPGSNITCIVIYKALSHSDGISSHNINVYAGHDCTLRLHTVQLLDGQMCLHNIGAKLMDNASCLLNQTEFGKCDLYTGACACLEGNNSSFSSDIHYVTDNSVTDMNYISVHTGKNTESNMRSMGVVRNNGKKTYRGTIDFVNGCTGSKGEEYENVLLLDENIVNRSIPLILCGEEDVEGNHGATIGNVDEATLFYMASRGINVDNAKKLFASARLYSALSSVPDEAIRKEIMDFCEEHKNVR